MDNNEIIEYLNQAKSFVGEGKNEIALEYINKAINGDKMNKELYIEKGIILANLEKYDDAIVEFNNALKLDKKYAEAYFHLGNLYLLKGDKSLGIQNYNKAISYGFDNPQIFYNLGMMYEEDGNNELAIRNYTKVIMIDPLRADARVRKAKIYIDTGRKQEALETLDELILSDPDLYDGYHLKSILLADMDRTDEALKVLDEAMELFPADPSFAIDKVNILVLKGEREKAEMLAVKIEEDYKMTLNQKRHLELEKARLYALDTDLDRVMAALVKAKEYTHEEDSEDIDSEATFLLASCALDKKDYKSAIRYSEELIESGDPEYAIPSYYTLPFAYAQAGEVEKARKLYDESIDKLRSITLRNPGILDGYMFRALCLKEIGKYDKALELSDYLLNVDDKSKAFHLLKAQVLHSMGNDEAAENEEKIADALDK